MTKDQGDFVGEESWRRPCSRMELACTCELFDGCCPVTDPVSPVLPLRKCRNTAWLWPLPLNFSPLLCNSNSQGGENLIVGDVKQSIYRWRGSDWKLLDQTVPEEFPEFEEEVLDTNYRSLANVVEFNNAYFETATKLYQ